MLRFRLSTILFLVVAISLGLAWYTDRTNLLQALQQQQHPIARYWEKHGYWSPSLYLNATTDELESRIADRIDGPSGIIVESSQGMAHANLRQPTMKTIDQVVSLLNDADHSTRLAAARLLALYLEAVSGRANADHNSMQKRAYIHATGQNKVRELLEDRNADIRAAGALIVGNFYFSRAIEKMMMDAFDRETVGTVKLYLAWAHHHIAD